MKTLTLETLKQEYRDELVRFDSWKDGKPGDFARLLYGDLKDFKGEPQANDFIMPKLCTGSDYAGDSVTVANHRAFLALFGTIAGVFDVYGGYSTYAVAIRLDAVTEDMLEVFAALQDYPLINEETHSEVEMEAEDASWECYARDDFRKLAATKFPALDIEEISADELYRIFRELSDRSNTYWQNETGNSAYIDLDRVIECAKTNDFLPPVKDGSTQPALDFTSGQ
jgi:hypothetical protein